MTCWISTSLACKGIFLQPRLLACAQCASRHQDLERVPRSTPAMQCSAFNLARMDATGLLRSSSGRKRGKTHLHLAITLTPRSKEGGAFKKKKKPNQDMIYGAAEETPGVLGCWASGVRREAGFFYFAKPSPSCHKTARQILAGVRHRAPEPSRPALPLAN